MKKKIILITTIPIIMLMLYSVNLKYKETEIKENKPINEKRELLAYTCEECETLPSTFPKKGQGYVGLGVTCTNGATADWDNETWDVDFINLVIPTACTVEFTPLYNVTATAPNGTVIGSPKEVAHGGLAAFEVIPNANYEYSSLSNCTGGSYDESTNVLTINNVTSNIACQVNFSLVKRTVTVTASGGSVTGSPKEVTHGSTVTFTVTPNTGYTYSSNTCGGTVSGNTLTIPNVTADKTCSVTFSPITYTITYNLNSGTQGSNAKTSYNITTSTFSLPTPTRTGYTFGGWYTTSGLTGTAVTQIAKGSTGNKTYYAKWTINKVTIRFHVNGGTVTASTTNDAGTTNSWTTTSSLVYKNGTLYTQSVNHGGTVNLVNYNNSKNLKITRSGYTAPDGAEWICHSGCTTANKTYDHISVDYNSSDFCDTSNGNCTVVLKVNWQRPTLYSKILADNPTRKTRTDFSTAFTTSNGGNTIYSASGQDGKTTYYFAGSVTNNYVLFAGKYWRIVRINEDNSVRLIYAGTSATDTAGYSSTSQAFNSNYNRSEYSGYKYTENTQHGTETHSAIKTHLDGWYTSNIKTSYDGYVSRTAIYCNDRTVTNGTWTSTGSSTFRYASYTRLYTNEAPTFVCSNENDRFTASLTTGNNQLYNASGVASPIATITADEITYAGAKSFTISNTSYYLYQNAKGVHWWIMTPIYWMSSKAYMFEVNGTTNGDSGLNNGGIGGSLVHNTNGVRPVLSLKSCVQWSSGTGTASSPYQVSLSSTCSSAEN